ncbi:MAG: DMT family transporter [Burkholderiales bacterium]
MPALRVSPHLMLIATASFWGAHMVIARAVVSSASPMSMSFGRWTVALAVLLPFAWPALVRERAKLVAAWKPILFFGTLGTVVYNAVGYIGLQHTTATNALLFQSLMPVTIPALAFLLFRDPIGVRTAIGLFVSLAGATAIVFRLDPAAVAAFRINPGDLWLLGNVLLWSLYTACMRWMPRDIDPLALLAAIMLAGMVTGVPACLADLALGGGIAWSPGVLAGLAYLGVFPSVVCYLLWAKGVAAIGPARAGAYLHVAPVVGISLSVPFLGERIELYHAVGFALIIGGVWLATRAKAA